MVRPLTRAQEIQHPGKGYLLTASAIGKGQLFVYRQGPQRFLATAPGNGVFLHGKHELFSLAGVEGKITLTSYLLEPGDLVGLAGGEEISREKIECAVFAKDHSLMSTLLIVPTFDRSIIAFQVPVD